MKHFHAKPFQHPFGYSTSSQACKFLDLARLLQAVSVAYVPTTRAYWATSAAGHVTVIDPRGPTRITDYVRNTRQAMLETLGFRGALC